MYYFSLTNHRWAYTKTILRWILITVYGGSDFLKNLYGSTSNFNRLWQLHPEDFPSIFLHGRQVKLPRWQQAYGRDYYFSGKPSKALAIPKSLKPYLEWGQKKIDPNLNGMLLNWYDAEFGHYIGAHRDSHVGLIEDSQIVMISLGGGRITRFRPVHGNGYKDIEVNDGDILIISLATNQHYKHEVPKLKRYQEKRISITLRCFDQ